ncbi:hypothetical protein CYY_002603 [Polysphondylium violaceum]|uniref:Uncharacterized protein n=1 Tax=Polysphondylium violaceum TaxID=133409 RepID=A0A8J4Q1E1_9MYCE|nr:hypothetical protein CYY_002603 [Polysphondylium violaceum]
MLEINTLSSIPSPEISEDQINDQGIKEASGGEQKAFSSENISDSTKVQDNSAIAKPIVKKDADLNIQQCGYITLAKLINYNFTSKIFQFSFVLSNCRQRYLSINLEFISKMIKKDLLISIVDTLFYSQLELKHMGVEGEKEYAKGITFKIAKTQTIDIYIEAFLSILYILSNSKDNSFGFKFKLKQNIFKRLKVTKGILGGKFSKEEFSGSLIDLFSCSRIDANSFSDIRLYNNIDSFLQEVQPKVLDCISSKDYDLSFSFSQKQKRIKMEFDATSQFSKIINTKRKNKEDHIVEREEPTKKVKSGTPKSQIINNDNDILQVVQGKKTGELRTDILNNIDYQKKVYISNHLHAHADSWVDILRDYDNLANKSGPINAKDFSCDVYMDFCVTKSGFCKIYPNDSVILCTSMAFAQQTFSKKVYQEGKLLIAPINVANNHWICGFFYTTHGESRFFTIDSMGSLKNSGECENPKCYCRKYQVKSHQKFSMDIQNDTNSCGYFTTDLMLFSFRYIHAKLSEISNDSIHDLLSQIIKDYIYQYNSKNGFIIVSKDSMKQTIMTEIKSLATYLMNLVEDGSINTVLKSKELTAELTKALNAIEILKFRLPNLDSPPSPSLSEPTSLRPANQVADSFSSRRPFLSPPFFLGGQFSKGG